jgi:hypothetical protein
LEIAVIAVIAVTGFLQAAQENISTQLKIPRITYVLQKSFYI